MPQVAKQCIEQEFLCQVKENLLRFSKDTDTFSAFTITALFPLNQLLLS